MTVVDRQRAGQSLAARIIIAVVVLAAVTVWVGIALVFFYLRCDENCSGDEAEHWRYAAQLTLAAAGSLAAVLGVAAVFTTHDRVRRVLLWFASACALVWVVWVLGGQGGF